jgi:hypothetical protein
MRRPPRAATPAVSSSLLADTYMLAGKPCTSGTSQRASLSRPPCSSGAPVLVASSELEQGFPAPLPPPLQWEEPLPCASPVS